MPVPVQEHGTKPTAHRSAELAVLLRHPPQRHAVLFEVFREGCLRDVVVPE